MKDLIALAKEKPGTINIAVPGRGTAASIASELFRREAGVNIVAVPYKGAPEAHTSVLRGDAHIFFSNLSAAAELIHSGKVRPLAVSTRERLAGVPGYPDAGGSRPAELRLRRLVRRAGAGGDPARRSWRRSTATSRRW